MSKKLTYFLFLFLVIYFVFYFFYFFLNFDIKDNFRLTFLCSNFQDDTPHLGLIDAGPEETERW